MCSEYTSTGSKELVYKDWYYLVTVEAGWE